MVRFTNILYPTDFSPAAAPALRYAAAIARWYNANLTVLHVVPTFDIVSAPPAVIGAAEVLVQPPLRDVVLSELVKAVPSSLVEGVTVTRDVVEGDAATAILDRAVGDTTNLIVIGTHGRRGFDRMLHGSVTDRVLHRAPCPVLTIPPHAPDAPDTAIFSRILCPVDFSPSSQQAFGFARDLASQSAGALTLLHVMEWMADIIPDSGALSASPDVHNMLVDDANRRLREMSQNDAHPWCDINAHVTNGRAHRAIVAEAERMNADLIVMGAQGRGGLSLSLFGSTTQHVSRHANCPVLVVRGADQAPTE